MAAGDEAGVLRLFACIALAACGGAEGGLADFRGVALLGHDDFGGGGFVFSFSEGPRPCRALADGVTATVDGRGLEIVPGGPRAAGLGLGASAAPEGCDSPTFSLDSLPPLAEAATHTIALLDSTDRWEVVVEGFTVRRSLAITSPADGVLTEGTDVVLQITPELPAAVTTAGIYLRSEIAFVDRDPEASVTRGTVRFRMPDVDRPACCTPTSGTVAELSIKMNVSMPVIKCLGPKACGGFGRQLTIQGSMVVR